MGEAEARGAVLMALVVDLRTRVLPRSHRMYMVRPGVGYHLFEALVEAEAVAPDLADLGDVIFAVPTGVRWCYE